MFFEIATKRTDQTYYTLKEEDHTYKEKTYVSLKKVYMDYNHVPGLEYDFANDHLGGWVHWNKLVDSPKLKPYIESWREELEIKIRAASVKEVIKVSKSEKGFQAAKWIAEGGYEPKTAGRPTKEQVAKEARIQAGMKGDIDDMFDRIQ